MRIDYMSLPSDLPAPEDDGAADHLVGLELRAVTLTATDANRVALDALGPGRDALRLPTFTADARRLYSRLTLVVRDGRIEHAFYPVFPPDRHAAQVLAWLRDRA
jgi:hypothetical protein